jgi:hypothetical protein
MTSSGGGGDNLQIWMVEVNILNKQSWTADNGWSFSLGVGRVDRTSHRKNKLVTKCQKGPLTWTDSLNKRKWT